MSDFATFDLRTQFPQYSCRLKKSHCTKGGLKILRIFIVSKFRPNNCKWDKKGKERSGYFRQKNLDFCKFIWDTVPQNTALSTAIFSLQPAEYKLV